MRLSMHLHLPCLFACILRFSLLVASAGASPSPKMTASCVATEHDAVTIALSKKESAEHLEAMGGLSDYMRSKPLLVQAYAMDDPNAPSSDEQVNVKVKVVHFVRHGQGFHNLMADMFKARGVEWEQYTHTKENPYVLPELVDAPLTEKGRQQAYALQPTVQSLQPQPELVVLSPQCRALQTGVMVFAHLVANASIPFMAHEMVREENGVHVCDMRRPTSKQAEEFPMVNFGLLETQEDVMFRNDRRETKLEVGLRIYKFFEWLSERPESHVAVASHSGWLFTMFNACCECNDQNLKSWFQTGEMKSVKLVFIQKTPRVPPN
jgi:broad specificity phosphatase PhoE